jgi:hypothetical protein
VNNSAPSREAVQEIWFRGATLHPYGTDGIVSHSDFLRLKPQAVLRHRFAVIPRIDVRSASAAKRQPE